MRPVNRRPHHPSRKCANPNHTNPSALCPECEDWCDTCDAPYPCPVVEARDQAVQGALDALDLQLLNNSSEVVLTRDQAETISAALTAEGAGCG